MYPNSSVPTGVQMTPLQEFMDALKLSLESAEGRHGFPGKAAEIIYRFEERFRTGAVSDLTAKLIAHDSDPNQQTLMEFVQQIVSWEYREKGATRPNDSYRAMGWDQY